MASSVKFGVLAQSHPDVDLALAAAPRIERLGWDFVDYPDQMVSTHPYRMLPDPAPAPAADPGLPTSLFTDQWYGSMEMCAAASVLTDEIPITLGVIDPLRRGVSLMAQEMVTLSHLSKGRITFAIGAGEAKQFVSYGEDRSKPITRMDDAIRTWYELWRSEGEPISRESRFKPLDDAIFPLSLYDGKPPPVLVVGAGEKVFDLAGTLCDGWLTYLPGGLTDDLTPIEECIGAIRQIAAAAGRDPDALRFNAMVNMVLAETDEQAWELARSPICGWISIAACGISSSEGWKQLGYEHPLGDFVWSLDMGPLVVPRDEVPAMTQKVPEEITNAVHVWGGPERVASRLQTFIDAGINEICFMNLGAAADPEGSATWNELISDVLVRLGRAPLNLDADRAGDTTATVRS